MGLGHESRCWHRKWRNNGFGGNNCTVCEYYYNETNTTRLPNITSLFEHEHKLGLKVYFNDHPHGFAPETSPFEIKYRYDGLTSILKKGLDYWWYVRERASRPLWSPPRGRFFQICFSLPARCLPMQGHYNAHLSAAGTCRYVVVTLAKPAHNAMLVRGCRYDPNWHIGIPAPFNLEGSLWGAHLYTSILTHFNAVAGRDMRPLMLGISSSSHPAAHRYPVSTRMRQSLKFFWGHSVLSLVSRGTFQKDNGRVGEMVVRALIEAGADFTIGGLFAVGLATEADSVPRGPAGV